MEERMKLKSVIASLIFIITIVFGSFSMAMTKKPWETPKCSISGESSKLPSGGGCSGKQG
jgi:hypothetical protein